MASDFAAMIPRTFYEATGNRIIWIMRFGGDTRSIAITPTATPECII